MVFSKIKVYLTYAYNINIKSSLDEIRLSWLTTWEGIVRSWSIAIFLATILSCHLDFGVTDWSIRYCAVSIQTDAKITIEVRHILFYAGQSLLSAFPAHLYLFYQVNLVLQHSMRHFQDCSSSHIQDFICLRCLYGNLVFWVDLLTFYGYGCAFSFFGEVMMGHGSNCLLELVIAFMWWQFQLLSY